MGIVRNLDSGGGGNDPPEPPAPKPKSKVRGGSPGLLTSTGGIFGTNFVVIAPIIDSVRGTGLYFTWNPFDFNSEEDTTYVFRQEEMQHARQVTIHKIVVTYRNLGKVKVTFSLSAYSNVNETFFSVPKTLVLGSIQADRKLYTKKIDLLINGERPYLTITRKANAGPLALTKVTLVGNANEEQLL